jgi:hypothetical protein
MRTGCVVSCSVRMMSLMKESEKKKNNRVLEGRGERKIRGWVLLTREKNERLKTKINELRLNKRNKHFKSKNLNNLLSITHSYQKHRK